MKNTALVSKNAHLLVMAAKELEEARLIYHRLYGELSRFERSMFVYNPLGSFDKERLQTLEKQVVDAGKVYTDRDLVYHKLRATLIEEEM